jgi:L-ascorbate metabolism protein UlaG (beta-lactamase superfamily)
VRVLTDPLLRSHVWHLRRDGPNPKRPEAVDAVLVSHLHYDHLDLPSLRMLQPAPRGICPAGAGRLMRRGGLGDVTELLPGESTKVRGVTIEATVAEHDASRRPLGPQAQPLGFVVRGERSVYFAGDTDLFDGMTGLGAVDVALLPVAGYSPKLGWGHLDPGRAALAVARIRPRFAVPIHWGTFRPLARRRGSWFTDPPARFAARVSELTPQVQVPVLAPGGALRL